MIRKAFFLGCMIPLKYPQIEAAVRLTMPRLDVELVDLEGFTCCPDPIFFKSVDQFAWLTVAARNLTVAESAGLDIATACSGCTTTLAEALHLLKTRPDLVKEVNSRLASIGRSFAGATNVRHLATILRDEVGLDRITAAVKTKIDGVKVAVHYGCHLLKPSEVAMVDDPDFPELQEKLVAAVGAEPVRYPHALKCCGKGCIDRTVPAAMAVEIVESAKAGGADALCLVCPSCFDSFELVQATGKVKKEKQLPVLSYFQLLGLAMGFSGEQLGFQFHRVPVPPGLGSVRGKR
ncbi:MAG: CoB--CoM heterodisulfide reductase iron-sulfur subunit B family protein [Planctomycetota bacterium]|nr:CoB--CoM heterodisulfide reductase iron-sulfur subunit B family protein [Planctomycetota bacterium]